jgi:hypothetical protein
MKVLGDLYNSLFYKPIKTNVYVDHKVWNQIKANLPKDYQIPDPIMINVISEYISKSKSSE